MLEAMDVAKFFSSDWGQARNFLTSYLRTWAFGL
jgi:hypothetical protein